MMFLRYSCEAQSIIDKILPKSGAIGEKKLTKSSKTHLGCKNFLEYHILRSRETLATVII